MSYICIVKILAIILSIYFLALNVVPCSDTGSVEKDFQVVSVVDFDNSHGDECELCSPFCNCHCCHVHTIDFGISEFEPLQTLIASQNFANVNNLGKDLIDSFFQPPRV